MEVEESSNSAFEVYAEFLIVAGEEGAGGGFVAAAVAGHGGILRLSRPETVGVGARCAHFRNQPSFRFLFTLVIFSSRTVGDIIGLGPTGEEMLTNAQLATMTLRHVIFHDVPNQRGQGGSQVILATIPTQIDAQRRSLLKEKLVKTLDSRNAYGMVFQADPNLIVPREVRLFTSTGYLESRFVAMSQALARHLYQVQSGAVSAGLLCVIDIVVDGQHGLVLMKLEREGGAELKMRQERGTTEFEMAVLDNLVLTGNTRLYKTAAFSRTGPGDDDFDMVACDNQHNPTDTKEMARFWRKYLGCDLEEAPRVSTAKFFNAAMEFINTQVDDATTRTVMYESLHVEMRSANPTFTPRSYLTRHVPDDVRSSFRDFLQERSIPLTTFPKDTQDIKGSIRRLTYISQEGVRIVAPEGRDELIQVQAEQIIVNDSLRKLGN